MPGEHGAWFKIMKGTGSMKFVIREQRAQKNPKRLQGITEYSKKFTVLLEHEEEDFSGSKRKKLKGSRKQRVLKKGAVKMLKKGQKVKNRSEQVAYLL